MHMGSVHGDDFMMPFCGIYHHHAVCAHDISVQCGLVFTTEATIAMSAFAEIYLNSPAVPIVP